MSVNSGDRLSTVRPPSGRKKLKTRQDGIKKLHHNNFNIEVILGDHWLELRLSEVRSFVVLNGDQSSTRPGSVGLTNILSGADSGVPGVVT